MEIHVERLLGRRVLDTRGRSLGRIEEILAERDGRDWVIRGYVLGLGGLIERLAAGAIVQALLGPVAVRRRRRTIPWHELDLSDPERPRLRSGRYPL